MLHDAWLSGFIDGEGCFSLDMELRPRLTIGLRDDDSPVLRALRESLGGSISRRRGTVERPYRDATWTLSGKAGLARLVAYLDAYPLRSRKARDYAIWRVAVEVYSTKGRAERRAELAALDRALRAVRRYQGPT